jgi:hypothetical protein
MTARHWERRFVLHWAFLFVRFLIGMIVKQSRLVSVGGWWLPASLGHASTRDLPPQSCFNLPCDEDDGDGDDDGEEDDDDYEDDEDAVNSRWDQVMR